MLKDLSREFVDPLAECDFLDLDLATRVKLILRVFDLRVARDDDDVAQCLAEHADPDECRMHALGEDAFGTGRAAASQRAHICAYPVTF